MLDIDHFVGLSALRKNILLHLGLNKGHFRSFFGIPWPISQPESVFT